MDLASASGPSNLDLETGSNIVPSPIVKKSRNGYIGFLTTIDVPSRKLWTHSITVITSLEVRATVFSLAKTTS
jgi:hypothetical protein